MQTIPNALHSIKRSYQLAGTCRCHWMTDSEADWRGPCSFKCRLCSYAVVVRPLSRLYEITKTTAAVPRREISSGTGLMIGHDVLGPGQSVVKYPRGMSSRCSDDAICNVRQLEDLRRMTRRTQCSRRCQPSQPFACRVVCWSNSDQCRRAGIGHLAELVWLPNAMRLSSPSRRGGPATEYDHDGARWCRTSDRLL